MEKEVQMNDFEKEKEVQEALGLKKPTECECCTRNFSYVLRAYKIKPYTNMPPIWVCNNCRMNTYKHAKALKVFKT